MTPSRSSLLPIVALWLDGRTCPVGDREMWALTPDEIAALSQSAKAEGFGLCVVSTCFRVELTISGSDTPDELISWGRRHLADARPHLDASVFRAASGEGALRHLFRVATGLESAVLGEAQILGQVRRARAASEASGVLTPFLRAVFDAAVHVGQHVRRETPIGRGAASTASAAIQWTSETLGGLATRRVVVAGAGQMGRLLLENLAPTGVDSITLVSSYAPPHTGFTVVRPEGLPALLPDTDAILTGTDRLVLDAAAAQAAWGDGALRAVADLGVPRNVDPAVQHLSGVSLADIDALGAIVDAGLAARRAAVPAVEQHIEDALAELHETLSSLDREQIVAEFRRRAESIRRDTLVYVCSKCCDRTCGLSDVGPGPGPCSDPERLSKTLTTRLLHDVTAALRAGEGDDATIRRLLALDDR